MPFHPVLGGYVERLVEPVYVYVSQDILLTNQ
jgi:hypothetical protein